MAVFTAAIAAVTAAIAAPALATVGAAAIAVGTAVGTAGLGLSVVGMVTGNKKLQKIGGYMGLAGGIVSLGGGIIGGAKATALYGKHFSTAWDDGVGKLFSDGPAVANAPTFDAGESLTNVQAGPGQRLAVTRPTAPTTTVPTGDGGGIIGPRLEVPSLAPSKVALPGRMSPHTAAASKGAATGSWWDDLATSDKLAVGLAGGRAAAGALEGMMTAGQMEEQNEIEREKLRHGGVNPRSPDVTLSRIRQQRQKGKQQ